MIGNKIKFSIFGESHGFSVGGLLENISPGLNIDEKLLEMELKRRMGGVFSTKRKEIDKVIFLSGLKENITTGAPICFYIENKNFNEKDYENLKNVPRPSHADYAAMIKYKGYEDLSGGGHFSARTTAAITVAGFIAGEELKRKNIKIYGRLKSLGNISDIDICYENLESLNILEDREIKMMSLEKIKEAENLINRLRKEKDSIGGVVEIIVDGINAGFGGANFSGVEGHISKYIFGVNGVKGIEFGSGFSGTKLLGSENNDEYRIVDGKVKILSNNSGGILGGITTGNYINFNVALKPTPSIGKVQRSVDLQKMENIDLKIEGRHDPSIAIRAVNVLISMSKIAILDLVKT